MYLRAFDWAGGTHYTYGSFDGTDSRDLLRSEHGREWHNRE